MKTKLFIFLVLTLLLSLNSQLSTLHAQGTAFTYQGRLIDGGGSANGNYDLRFTIYDAVTNGVAQAGPLTNAPTSVSNGLFTVTLDFGTGVFSGADRWLSIGVRSNGSVAAYQDLSPRQKLTATPYATRAANFSGNVAANQITGNISANNIGAGSITTVMLAAGAVGSNQLASGAVTTGALADGAVTATKVATVSEWFARTIPNPTPAGSDVFGYSVAAVGTDRMIIGAFGDDTGASSAGTAYLFSTNGTLLTTFTNPTPAVFDAFGISVAAVGTDRVLIGAYGDSTGASAAGAAYLFNTNGTLLTTFTNPTPESGDQFGFSVTAVGDRVLIGTYGDATGAPAAGAAYLFSANGALLTTFTNPTPAASDQFGFSVAAVGTDRVLIGASRDATGAPAAGAAYLFSANGALLTTFTNPTPAVNDVFGYSLAAVGTDRVLIGAYGDDTGASSAGTAYLFSTNGTLLTTFTNPTPASFDQFGISVAALGGDRVLIGADQDGTGASAAGAVYLFSVNGTLLMTFTNPTPASFDQFGTSVAAVGSDRVLIGAHNDDTGATSAGVAYLFSTENFADGLVADTVRARSVTTVSLEDGAVTAAKIGGVLFVSQIPNLDGSKITDGTIANADISASAAIADTKLATITTAGKVADSALSANVALLSTAQIFSADKSFSSGTRLLADPGSATAPGIAFVGDTDTGILRPVANALALSTAGTNRLRISAEGNVAIGIPAGSVDATLHVQNTTGASRPIKCDRVGTDGQLIAWARDDTVVGDVSVAAGIVSYNAFTGSHYAWLPRPVEYGTLVALTGDNRRPSKEGEIVYGVTPTSRANDPACLGAYLAPHRNEEPAAATDQHQIMSVGNGEMWVTQSDTGDIRPGDYLISSEVAGSAMKDDPARFPVGHICARAAEAIDWPTVAAGANGRKQARISVLLGNFVRDSRGAAAQNRSEALAQELKRRDAEHAELKQRLERLERLMSEKNDGARS